MSTELEQQSDQAGTPEQPEPTPTPDPVPSTIKGKLKVFFFLLVFLGVIAAVAMTSFYTIPAGRTGVVLRFGKYAGTADPGLGFNLPFGIDRIVELESGAVMTETFGFRNMNPGVGRKHVKDAASAGESSLLTGDLSVIGLEWTIQYQCRDPKKYLFALHDPAQTVRDAGEEAMRAAAGDASIDYVLVNRDAMGRECGDTLQATLDSLDSGIRVVSVKIQEVIPPEQVKAAFDEVGTARQERDKLVQEALADYNREVPKARGEAQGMLSTAEGYAVETVNRAAGEASRFNSLLGEYRGAREVTKKRLYLETCREVMPRARQVIVVDSRHKDVIPRLNLDKPAASSGGAR